MPRTIGNPLSWTAQILAGTGRHMGKTTAAMGGDSARIELRRITVDDVRDALRRGAEDFWAFRSYVIFICLIYPLAGLCLIWFAAQQELLPFVFPLVSGFALVGPITTIGLQELSRRREMGRSTGWSDAFSVLSSPALGPILVLSFYLVALFIAWMVSAHAIWLTTLGPEPPASAAAFLGDVFTTPAGWAMIGFGIAVGFVFAAVALATSIVSFALVLDRHVGVPLALAASLRFTRDNPRAVALWGLIVAALLAIGTITALVGLAVVLPLLGHATWHLYRAAAGPVARS